MSEDRRRPQQYASRRDEALQRWIADVVYPYSVPLRRALDAAGLGRTGIRSTSDLRRLPVTPLAELGDGRRFVLEPTAEAVAAHGPLTERLRLRVADAFGRRPELARQRIDPAHRPVRWTADVGSAAAPLFVAHTAADLTRLGELGRRALATSGVRRTDRVLLLGSAGPGVAALQFVEGCRDGGVALLAGGRFDSSLLGGAEPTVVAGDPDAVAEAVAAGLPGSVRLVVRLGDDAAPADPASADGLVADVAVSDWWAPPGVRAAWARCPGGTGHHTWPTEEALEVTDDGLVWSAVGWHGSVWLRVALGVAGVLHTAPCPACGRTTPRVECAVRPEWMAVLDAAPAVSSWIGVRRADGSTVVLAAPSAGSDDGWRAALADRIGRRIVGVTPERYGRVRALAGAVDVVDEAAVADALRKDAPA